MTTVAQSFQQILSLRKVDQPEDDNKDREANSCRNYPVRWGRDLFARRDVGVPLAGLASDTGMTFKLEIRFARERIAELVRHGFVHHDASVGKQNRIDPDANFSNLNNRLRLLLNLKK